MKEDTKRAKLAALFGLEEHLPTEPTPDFKQEQHTASREAEAVIAYVQRPQLFKQVECKQCGLVFAVDRGNVAYCKDECRKHYLALIGITWDPRKPPEERWDYKEPLTVPPQALVVADLAVEVLIHKAQQAEQETSEQVSGDQTLSETLPSPIVYNL